MKWEPLGLVAALIVFGGGLAYLAMGVDDRPVSNPNSVAERLDVREAASADSRPEDVAVAKVAGGLVEQWTIDVQDGDGALVDGASVTVRSGGHERTGVGPSVRLTSVDAGAWDVIVRAKGYFDARTRVVLEPAPSRHTVVRMTTTGTLTGHVVDTRGDPVERTRVWLLPSGAVHPGESSTRFEMSNAMTSSMGEFSMPVDAGETYRLSIGDAGDARETSERFEVRGDAALRVRWVVPATVRLTVRVEGLDEDEVVHVDVVTDETSDDSPQSTPASGPRDSDMAGTVSSGSTRPKEQARVNRGTDEPAGDGAAGSDAPSTATTALLAEERARMAAMLEDDGVQVTRLRVREGRDAVASALPVGMTLRFRLVRGAETFNVSVPFQPRQSDDARLTLTATQSLPAGTAPPLRRRSAVGVIERVQGPDAALRPGLEIR